MTKLVSLDRTHSRISPSNFERSEACTASVKLCAQAPTPAPGMDALVGTAAHAVIEKCLKEELDTFELGRLKFVKVDGQDIAVDLQMLENVQLALDAVRKIVGARQFQIEQTLKLAFVEQYLGKPMWGHADVLVPSFPVIVIDYKNGFNLVPANSSQLGLYLLAATLAHDEDLHHDGHAGTTVIIQPNASGEPVRSHEWSWEDLRNLHDRVIHMMRRVKRQDWTYQDGSHCRFCPAAAFCTHLAAVARDSALTRVTPSPELVASGEWTAERLNEALLLVDRLDAWSKAVSRAAEDYLVHGGRLADFKLVRKRTTRRWIDDNAAVGQLTELGVDPWQRKLVTPAEAERRAQPVKRAAIKALAEQPTGEATVAPASDPRKGIEVMPVLRAALQSSAAAGYFTAAKSRLAIEAQKK